eukprot:10616558-Alexandrium_andersonii.AAC.1
MHPSSALEANFEAVPGSAQFKLRMPGAMLHAPKLLEHETSETWSCLNTTLQCCERVLLRCRTAA